MSIIDFAPQSARGLETLPGRNRSSRFADEPNHRSVNSSQSRHTVIVIVARPEDDKAAIARELHSALSSWLDGDADDDSTVAAIGPLGPAGSEHDSQILVFGNLRIDRPRREVRLGQNLIELTKTEFDFLFHLASRSGIVLTRNEIVEACKGVDYPVTLRSVDVQIAGLRRKLGPAASHLQTLRGVGYRWLDQ
jgi:DNA-binding response OmpR family regulator